MARFADINVSQGSVATNARSGGIVYSQLTANLPGNLPVKNIVNRLRLDRIRIQVCVPTFFAPPCCNSYRQRLLRRFVFQTLQDVQFLLVGYEPVSSRSVASDHCPHEQRNGGRHACNVSTRRRHSKQNNRLQANHRPLTLPPRCSSLQHKVRRVRRVGVLTCGSCHLERSARPYPEP